MLFCFINDKYPPLKCSFVPERFRVEVILTLLKQKSYRATAIAVAAPQKKDRVAKLQYIYTTHPKQLTPHFQSHAHQSHALLDYMQNRNGTIMIALMKSIGFLILLEN